MRFHPFLALGLCVSVAHAQPNEIPATVVSPPQALVQEPARAPRPIEPKAQIEKDLKELFVALNGLKAEGIQNGSSIGAHLSGARLGFFGGQEWENYFTKARGNARFQLDDLELKNLDVNEASVTVFYELGVPGAPKPQLLGETLTLKRERVPWLEEEKWRIVMPTRKQFESYRPLMLNHIAYFAGQRAGTLPQLRGEISATQLKQCALGVLQFVQDYDEIFRFENEFWRDAIRPYVKNETVFQIPGTRDFYTFNDNLSDKPSASIGEPAKTVLFYEGHGEEPIFRYDGRAAVCFADGHIELITRAQEQTLIWKPKAP